MTRLESLLRAVPAVLLCCIRLAGQEPAPVAVPERIDTLVESVRAAHDVPALAGAFVVDGRLVRIGVSGMRRRGGQARATLDDRWHLGSCTKAMTATLCARLVERGVLAWDRRVGAAFPERAERMDPRFRDATLAGLLTMTAGVPSDLQPNGLWGTLWRREGTPSEQRFRLLDGIIPRTPSREPGTYEYANASYAVAGLMAEQAAGLPFEELMKHQLFGPLGMESAGFGPPPASDGGEPLVGHAGPEGIRPVWPGIAADNPPAIAPAGTVHATLEDWARFIAAHLEGRRGRSPLLEAATIERLHTPPEGRDYAFGWIVTQRSWGGRVLTHSGSNTMWYAVAWLAPEKGFAALAVTNQAGNAGPRATDALVGRLIAEWRAPVARISGRVRFAGTPPDPDLQTVDDAMRAVCGHETHGDRTLTIGAGSGLANALVALVPEPPPEGRDPSWSLAAPTVLEKRACALLPRVLVVPPRATVTFRNVDSPCRGFALSRRAGSVSLMVGSGEEATHSFGGPEVVAVVCPVRTRDMVAHVVVLDTPHWAVTGEDGRFEIANLVPGTYRLRFWHERTGWRQDAVDPARLLVVPGANDPLRIDVPDGWLKKGRRSR